MEERNERCEACRFWYSHDALRPRESGDCRRLAPRKILADIPGNHAEYVAHGLWPETAPDEWCGEFEPNPAGPAAP